MGDYTTDMSGKTVLITGATSGIGQQTALDLASLGARVLLHGRSEGKAAVAADAIRAAIPGADLVPVAADLSSMDEVRQLAGRIAGSVDRLDVLVNNAGVYMQTYVETVDGIETTFAVNHVAAFVLTALLDDLLVASAPSRIVTVSSVAHFRGTLDPDNMDPVGGYDGYEAYAASKLANVLFAVEAAARFSGSGVTSNSLHPGIVDTKLLHASYESQQGADVSVGALTPVYVASSPDLEDVTGRYFVNQHPAQATPLTGDHALRNRLWEVSQTLGGVAAR